MAYETKNKKTELEQLNGIKKCSTGLRPNITESFLVNKKILYLKRISNFKCFKNSLRNNT